MKLSPLQETELHRARLSGGSVDPLEAARDRSREPLGAGHTCLRWSGKPPDER